MADLDRLLRSDISHAAARAAELRHFAPIENRGRQRRRTHTLLAVAAAAVVVLVGVGGLRVLTGQNTSPPTPIGPPTPTVSTPTEVATGWTGPLRSGVSMPLVSQPAGSDGRDAAFGGVDILEVASGGPWREAWILELRARPPRASTLDPARTIIEYGVVIDVEADGDADCQIGVNNDAPKAGDHRVWVTNLTTGETAEHLGPPYGDPIDVFHPDEVTRDVPGGGAPIMKFAFLQGHAKFNPCAPIHVPSSYYAYASLTEAGRVTAFDYAPDAAWLEMP